MAYRAFLLLLSLVSILPACASKDIHPDLDADTDVLVREWTIPTRKEFEAGDRGAEFSNPAVAENTLVFGNRTVGLVALYPKINQVRWALPIPGGVVSELTVDQSGGVGTVYFGGGDGFLYSANLENGRVNWRYEVRNPMISKPVIHGGRLFITTSDDTVYAFDAGTGKWLWHYRRRSAPPATILGASAPLIDGNEVLVGLSDGFLVSLSAEEGQLKWERKLHLGTKFTDVDARPVVDNGVLYVPSYDGSLYALKRAGGETLWRFDAGGSKQVVIEKDKIFLPSSDGTIYALEKESAKVAWKFEMDEGTPTQIISTEKYLIVGSSYQYLYAIDKKTGKAAYRFNAGYGSGFSGAPAYDPATRRLYILSGAGNLYAFTLRGDKKKMPHAPGDGYKFLSL